MSRPVRALVTGGAGFIGHHLVWRLVQEGNEVLVVDDLSTGRADRLPADARLEQLDVSGADLAPLWQAWHPDVVFHLAAQASVARSMTDPDRDRLVNLVGTRNAVFATRPIQSRLVFTSSGGAVYGDVRRPATESTATQPTSFYGVHKLAAEGYVRAAGLPHAIARPSNVFGPGQQAGLEGAVVASFVDQAHAGGPLQIHGDGSQERDFVHVLDVVDALVRLAHLSRDGTWNVAAGESRSILAVADAVESAAGRSLGRAFAPPRGGDVQRSSLSNRRLRATGWKASRSLQGFLGDVFADRGEHRHG